MNFPTVKNLKVVGIAGRGTARERVILRAVNPCNLAKYAVVQGIPGQRGVSSTNRLVYWFPDVTIEAGDYILLYSQNGTASTEVDDDGDTLHVFYWMQGTVAVWPTGRTPILVHISALAYKG